MSILFQLAASVVSLYILVLLVRVVIDWVQILARDWRPRGAALVIAEVVYSLTDPPLRAFGGSSPHCGWDRSSST